MVGTMDYRLVLREVAEKVVRLEISMVYEMVELSVGLTDKIVVALLVAQMVGYWDAMRAVLMGTR